ncbi:MAG: hypothetical protein IJU92_03945, partial [Spirochaetaceae bacterium]|nr:hypothetical protein [Spirochaetaceae bacterium]
LASRPCDKPFFLIITRIGNCYAISRGARHYEPCSTSEKARRGNLWIPSAYNTSPNTLPNFSKNR